MNTSVLHAAYVFSSKAQILAEELLITQKCLDRNIVIGRWNAENEISLFRTVLKDSDTSIASSIQLWLIDASVELTPETLELIPQSILVLQVCDESTAELDWEGMKNRTAGQVFTVTWDQLAEIARDRARWE